MLKLPGDSIRVLVEGISRGRVSEILFEVPFFKCRIEPLPDEEGLVQEPEAEALMRTVLGSFNEYVEINQNLAPEIFSTIVSIDNPGRLADMIASHLEIRLEDKQSILEILDQKERLKKLNEILLKEIEILNIEQDISTRVKECN